MERPVRIAVVGKVDERLLGDLRQLPLAPEVQPMSSLIADTEALMRFQPEVLLVQLGPNRDEDVGAIKLLQRLWPTLRTALICTPADEVTTGPVAARVSAKLLVYPEAPGQLAAVLEQLMQDSDRPRPELFVGLAHGLADEINNPLLFVSGHLQLLRAQLAEHQLRDHRDQVDAALAGLQRIQTSVDRLRLLSQAADGPRASDKVDIAELVSAAVAARSPDQPTATIDMAAEPVVARGDREQLDLAVQAIVAFADEVAALTGACHLSLTSSGKAVRMQVSATGPSLAAWQLPNTFEPFYPQRVVRGRSHGLGLFLAQTIVLGHRGQATVRRRQDGTLQFDFVLPR